MFAKLKFFFSTSIFLLVTLNFGCRLKNNEVSETCAEEVPCGLEVTAINMSCAAYGAFGNIYFLTDRGEYLQPWEAPPTLLPVKVTAGKRYVIGYKKAKRDNRHKDQIRCTLHDEKVEKALPVKLTCLREINCGDTEAVVSDMRPVDGCLEFVTADGERLLPDISHLNINLEDGQRIRFSYTVTEGIIPCGTRRPVIGKVAKVKCLEFVEKKFD